MQGESGNDRQRSDGPAPRARLDWVDALKGIGIVAVIAAHVWTRGPVRDAIYAVHMPLFFLLSGYTARHVPWRTLLPASLRTLGLPFLCFSLLLIGADFLIEGAKGYRPIFPGWIAGLQTIFFETEKTRGPFTILWFIPCLFLARLAWNAIIGRDRRAGDWPVLLAMLGAFALSLLAQACGHWSPLGALAVPGALLMIWAGALWRQRGQPAGWLGYGVAGLALVTLVAFPPLNMKLGDLGWPLLSLAGAGAVTITLAGLVQRLPERFVHILATLGRASLVIMYGHVAVIHYLTPYAPKAVLFPVALAASFLLDRLIRTSGIARRLLLGEAKPRVKSIDS